MTLRPSLDGVGNIATVPIQVAMIANEITAVMHSVISVNATCNIKLPAKHIASHALDIKQLLPTAHALRDKTDV